MTELREENKKKYTEYGSLGFFLTNIYWVYIHTVPHFKVVKTV